MLPSAERLMKNMNSNNSNQVQMYAVFDEIASPIRFIRLAPCTTKRPKFTQRVCTQSTHTQHRTHNRFNITFFEFWSPHLLTKLVQHAEIHSTLYSASTEFDVLQNSQVIFKFALSYRAYHRLIHRLAVSRLIQSMLNLFKFILV